MGADSARYPIFFIFAQFCANAYECKIRPSFPVCIFQNDSTQLSKRISSSSKIAAYIPQAWANPKLMGVVLVHSSNSKYRNLLFIFSSWSSRISAILFFCATLALCAIKRISKFWLLWTFKHNKASLKPSGLFPCVRIITLKKGSDFLSSCSIIFL